MHELAEGGGCVSRASDSNEAAIENENESLFGMPGHEVYTRWRYGATMGHFSRGVRVSALHAKQSFQSNKTHRKLCEVLTTYQMLYYQKTLKKKV